MTKFLKHSQVLALSIMMGAMIINSTDLQAYSAGPASVNGNGYTGAPGDQPDSCDACHSDGVYGDVAAVISVVDTNGPVSSFVPGITYTITVEVTNTANTPAAYGFQATVLDSANAPVGTLSNASTGTTVVGGTNGRTYWEHSPSSASNIFTIDWTAPTAMTTVTIYAAGSAVNLANGNNGDNGGSGTNFAATLPVELLNFSID